jgi:hypothetical protein
MTSMSNGKRRDDKDKKSKPMVIDFAITADPDAPIDMIGTVHTVSRFNQKLAEQLKKDLTEEQRNEMADASINQRMSRLRDRVNSGKKEEPPAPSPQPQLSKPLTFSEFDSNMRNTMGPYYDTFTKDVVDTWYYRYVVGFAIDSGAKLSQYVDEHTCKPIEQAPEQTQEQAAGKAPKSRQRKNSAKKNEGPGGQELSG